MEELISKENHQVEITIDEATRDCPGSPNIPRTILEKIKSADIFVGDVSIIQSDARASTKTPNPNVVFELGYAVANLGWERVLLLLNKAHGSVELLPFDFDRHRATPFILAQGNENQQDLKKTLFDAISMIVSKDPPRPKAGLFNVVEAQRGRDLTNIRWLLSAINWPTIDEHISNGPKFLTVAATVFYDKINGVLSSTLFHIYDKELDKCIRKFVKHWTGSLKYDHYVPMIGQSRYVFKPGHPSQRAKENKEFEYMQAERLKMYKAMRELQDRIREKFPEIDLMALSNEVGRRYDSEVSEAQQRFAKPLVPATPPRRKGKG